ncbi:prolipoprotein diacylglyceryl transferase [Kineococcus rhizosphaerae]|uniref:Phosphatidylglycerol--prolipoprotein diacylglyceryl transferase n=1 Tax=Kineococcus rhizosphaerae TaxID=559628 RepID=A0A2T0R9Z2_9ACTN|nr:prolipoprotein diacylglyceryl transferase [Kineococcus rhizosphaerae]PRY17974.1 prolipoprotein diacylglyceryl transferase [Kineococcus rhizosphaerae]
MIPAAFGTAIPSPTVAVWHLGPLPVRAYALCIVAGIVLGVLVAERRWRAKGGRQDFILDVAVWAVPLGVVGARLYHVITSPQAYFGAGGDPVRALYVWEGGLGIWGAIAGGALGAWIACRRGGYRFWPLADAMAPGLLVAQAAGRWGNWFNNELYGRATDVPWALTVHRWDESAGRAVLDANGDPQVLGTFQPTFLYESLWCLLVAGFIVLADRRWTLRHGQSFFAYVALYCVGRSVFEALRIDTANHFLHLRVNQWVAALVFLLALVAFVRSRRRHSGRQDVEDLEREGARSPSSDDESSARDSESLPTVDSPTEEPDRR